ncbi:MAG: hypothetical protein Q7T61_00960 [Caulobacter sp.]|nr:hypothetical protein [Caulobacter sp.]
MTTVAYRDGVLAADTLATWGDNRDGRVTKIAKRGSVLAAISGSLSHGQAFLDWFRSGMKGDPPPMGDTDGSYAHGHLITEDGWICMWGPRGWERSKAHMYAAGTGMEFAKGAMSAGLSPSEAVAVAIQHDTKSGGEITVLTH